MSGFHIRQILSRVFLRRLAIAFIFLFAFVNIEAQSVVRHPLYPAAGGGSPPVFDTFASVEGDFTQTAGITVASGSNRILIAVVGYFDPGVVSGVGSSVNGAFTNLPSASVVDAGGNHADLYYLLAPTTGAHTISFSITGGASGYTLAVYSLSNVNQSTPFGTPATNSGSSTAPTVTLSSGSTEAVIDMLAYNNGSASMTSHTNRTLKVSTNTEADLATSILLPGTGSSVMDWTVSSGPWAIAAIGVKGI